MSADDAEQSIGNWTLMLFYTAVSQNWQFQVDTPQLQCMQYSQGHVFMEAAWKESGFEYAWKHAQL